MIVRLGESTLRTKFGEYREYLYYDGQRETIAMVLGDVGEEKDILCRIHSSCVHGHYFNSLECDCQGQMTAAQQQIQKAGKGIIILMDQEGKGNGHFALLKSIEHKRKGVKQADAYIAAGFKKDNRDFSAAAKILKDLKIGSVQLITDNPKKQESLAKYGVKVSGIASL